MSRSPDISESIDFGALAITPPTSTVHPQERSRRGTSAVSRRRTGASTPSLGAKRRQMSARKLFQEGQRAQTPAPEWSEDEVKQLITFLLLYTDGSAWTLHKNVAFWKAAGEFLQQCLGTVHCRSGWFDKCMHLLLLYCASYEYLLHRACLSHQGCEAGETVQLPKGC